MSLDHSVICTICKKDIVSGDVCLMLKSGLAHEGCVINTAYEYMAECKFGDGIDDSDV